MIEPQILGRDMDEIRTLVAMWQEALGLDEWSVDVELIEARQMPEQAAACAFTAARREAKIRLATDVDSEEELHNCIAHELMHLLHFGRALGSMCRITLVARWRVKKSSSSKNRLSLGRALLA